MTAAAPSEVVLLGGELVPPAEAVVSAFDRGLLYGESLFETLKVVAGAPCLWEPHRDRLLAGCRELGLPLVVGELEEGVRRLLKARPVELGVLRIQVTGGVQPGGGRGITAPVEGRCPSVVATVVETAAMPADIYARGIAVVTAADLCRPLPRLKSGNYLASVAAKARAETAGAFECLFVGGTPPSLLEGSFTSVLAWDGTRLLVPPEEGRLPGVTLAAVLAAARSRGLTVEQRPIAVPGPETPEAGGGPALFLTSSFLGLCECASLDGRTLARAPALAADLRGALAERERASCEAWRAAGRARG
ncbi:MAG: hypothetical protein Kow00122_17870 [Thermoleophilia bacterium]